MRWGSSMRSVVEAGRIGEAGNRRSGCWWAQVWQLANASVTFMVRDALLVMRLEYRATGCIRLGPGSPVASPMGNYT